MCLSQGGLSGLQPQRGDISSKYGDAKVLVIQTSSFMALCTTSIFFPLERSLLCTLYNDSILSYYE